MNIAFLGTPNISKCVLEKLSLNKEIDIKVVVTKPDKKRGRKMILTPCEAKQFALDNNLNVISPEKLDNEFVEYMKSLDLDYIVVVAYGKILKQNVLDIPKKACINLHVSKLPKYRGAAPIQWAVLNGDKQTAVTTMLMDIGMDTGDILEQQDIDIPIDMTAGELFDVVGNVGAELLEHTLLHFDEILPKKQEGQSSLAPMIEKDIAQIDWNKTSFEIHNKVRGLNPYLGAVTKLDDTVVKIWKTKLVEREEIETKKEKEERPGSILIENKRIFVKTGDSFVEILELQYPNSKKVSAKDFLNGHNLQDKMFS